MSAISPASLKKSIGDRLRSSGTYAELLEEMPRCWRLNYANEFHLDITPSIPNPSCRMGGELVPDKTLRIWKASNPQGYRAKFDRRAALVPGSGAPSARPSIRRAPTPTSSRIRQNRGLKGILRRIVQIAKRHRDIHFIDEDQTLAPLSIIITTLASRAYEYCVTNFEYDDELDLVCDVVPQNAGHDAGRRRERPPDWICGIRRRRERTSARNGTRIRGAPPRSFPGTPRRSAISKHLLRLKGLDQMRRLLGSIFGTAPATKAMDALTERVNRARSGNRLSVGRAAGLIAGTASRNYAGPRQHVFRRRLLRR